MRREGKRNTKEVKTVSGQEKWCEGCRNGTEIEDMVQKRIEQDKDRKNDTEVSGMRQKQKKCHRSGQSEIWPVETVQK